MSKEGAAVGLEELEEFVRRFAVPPIALPYLDQIVTGDERRLVLAAASAPLTTGSAQQVLGVSASEAAEALQRAFRRSVLSRGVQDDQVCYTPTNLYTRLDAFATYETWADLPAEARRALDQWMLQEYIVEVRPIVERLMAGSPAPGSPGNDSVMLLAELDGIVDAARTIVVVPCNCRRIAERCRRPTETCVQLDDLAELQLERRRGRRLMADEAKALLRWADRKGLMHTTDLDLGAKGPTAICNCCADDCYVFRAAVRLGSKGVWPRSRYVAVFDAHACTLCGACLKRCHFGAFYSDGQPVEQGGRRRWQVAFDPGLCWGCGLCATACPAKAITMQPLAAASG